MLAVLLIAGQLLAQPPPAVDRAFQRLYNFDFSGAESILRDHLARQPGDPVASAALASSYLFRELDRLMILESDFFADDDRIAEKRKLRPDPDLKDRFSRTVATAQQSARERLSRDGADRDALFAMAISYGLITDYNAFIEKRQVASLSTARQSQEWATRLLKVDPSYADAYLTNGISEYLLGSLPFFVRWFVRFEGVEGDKQRAVANLKTVAARGRYLGPFARILLAIVAVREKKPAEAVRYLSDLTREFPENPLLKRELAKLSPSTAR